MPGGEQSSRRARRATRRWPAVLAATGVAAALALTAFLVMQDRENLSAASSSRANAHRDALAVSSLTDMARSMAYASAMAHLGVVGLKDIGLHAYQDGIIDPLGGTLTLATGGWTLAIGDGWACLHWTHHDGDTGWFVTRGVCPGASINVTPSVTTAAARAALDRTDSTQHAALLAAFAAAAASRASKHISVRALAAIFAGHRDALPFRYETTPFGVSVQTNASAACLRPLHRHGVSVSLGSCP